MSTIKQTKLTKAEWDAIESPVHNDEKEILQMIIEGYNDVDIKKNTNLSIIDYSKIEKTPEMEAFMYSKFFKERISQIQQVLKKVEGIPDEIITYDVKKTTMKPLKKADNIRIENMGSNIEKNIKDIMEYTFLDFVLKMTTPKDTDFYLYTLLQLKHVNVTNLNPHVIEFVNLCVEYYSSKTKISESILEAHRFIEKNPYLYKYSDKTLYDHQKKLFAIFRKSKNKYTTTYTKDSNMVLYIAPTGTGKTLSPIGLSNDYRIIFVCAARHVGLALAKAAVAAQKCVAFAFGCETAADIRLHYYSALKYTINKRSGGIGKVDNSVGGKVEIMICDAKSYLTAMYYMLSFNPNYSMITYWDEPTITMDYDEHELHDVIHRNWSENKIPNIVFSSATLPDRVEIQPVLNDFIVKFDNTEIHQINSFDCKKSISLINKNGYCICPHLMYSDYAEIQECVLYCEQNRTLFRYFDLKEVVRFIAYLKKTKKIPESYDADEYFGGGLKNVTMNSIKLYYLQLIKHIEYDWTKIYEDLKTTQKRNFARNETALKALENVKKSSSLDSRFGNSIAKPGENIFRTASVAPTPSPPPPTKSYIVKAREASVASGGMLLTTVDAHTLTDGPTIYLAEDVEKIGNFYIQQSNIPKTVYNDIIDKITENNSLLAQIALLEESFEDVLAKEMKNEKKITSENFEKNPELDRMNSKIKQLKQALKMITMESLFIPNTVQHQEMWVSPDKAQMVENAYCPSIDTTTVQEIMELSIAPGLKILLLLGIGSFAAYENTDYVEIVKRLAVEKRLFIIIASSDYIYGTNYQFCHGIIGKDLVNMTPQKTIQSLGRIGRGNIQQEYTARFRDDLIIENLFKRLDENMEAKIMNKLFVTDEEDE
jgi:hypothetical protein